MYVIETTMSYLYCLGGCSVKMRNEDLITLFLFSEKAKQELNGLIPYIQC